jgi:hypothetical protein
MRLEAARESADYDRNPLNDLREVESMCGAGVHH